VLLLATFLTIHFGEWKESWHGTTGLAQVGDSAFHTVRPENEGVLAAIDPETGECLWTLTLDTPAGFALSRDYIYVNSMYGNSISILSPSLEPVDVIARWFMNDLHSLVLTDRGLLLTSSGLDAVMEVDLTGDEIWSWFATDRAYPARQEQPNPRLRRQHDHRRTMIATHQQATHCNNAIQHPYQGSDAVMVTLFHQGEVIAVDRATLKHTTVLGGMDKPHSLRKALDGWLISDSRNNCVVFLDDDFWIVSVIEGGFDWVQDALVYDDRILVADANHSRLVWLDINRHRHLGEIRYSDQWKVYQIEVVDGLWEDRLRAGRATSLASRLGMPTPAATEKALGS